MTTATPSPTHHDGPILSRRRVVLLLALLAVAALVAGLPQMHGWAERVIADAGRLVVIHPAWGGVVFVLLAALSAMLAFFSSAVVVPVALSAWGALPTLVLLWVGWLLGGICSYAIGRLLRRSVVERLAAPERVAYYTRVVSRRLPFPLLLLFQAALPSEIPGYVLGIVRYRFASYLLALGLAELPYAVGAVVLGDSFLAGRYVPMIAVGVFGIVAVAWAGVQLHRSLGAGARGESSSDRV
ncbi:MAG TPA: VTT domain-containing protein [Gemmatimonadales bacterium]|nr:VTT domain-containing protein [Gemmatimonadales bacterium]